MPKKPTMPEKTVAIGSGAYDRSVKESVKNIPRLPGVYIMKDEYDQIIYIGKAINLKRRVSGYFQNSKNAHPKIKKMVTQIRSLEIHTADTELEALIMECTLIKKHRPIYNALLKNDKQYPYIRITNETFPCLHSTASLYQDGASYYGPYRGAYEVEETVSLIQRIFKIRSCNRVLDGSEQTPCLNYHVKRCAGPCCQGIEPQAYQNAVAAVVRFIQSGENEIVERLNTEMHRASDSLDFETAARYRNDIANLNHFLHKQHTIQEALKEEITLAFARSHIRNAIQIYLIDFGLLRGKACISLDRSADEQQTEIAWFLSQHLAQAQALGLASGSPSATGQLSGIPTMSKNILQKDIDEIIIIQGWLSHGGKRLPGGLRTCKINKNGADPYQDGFQKSCEIWKDFVVSSLKNEGTI